MVPTPSQHSGMVRNQEDKDAQAGWTKSRVPVQGTAVQWAG